MKRLSLISLLAGMAMTLSAAVPAEVTRAVKQVNAAPALDVVCTINGTPAALSLSHPCFSIDLGGAKIFYDGTTQWSYSEADKEVTILNPTADELSQANPLFILRNLANDYTGTPVKGRPNTVRLTPLDPSSEVAEATVTFNPTTGWPTSMVLVTGSGRADIANLKFTPSKTKRPAGAFKFQAPKGTRVTDLR